ncbi:MAG TPA: glycoside hydrolase family 130 protein [Acidimicrobiales bacterium]
MTDEGWPIGPFTAHGEVLGALTEPEFSCPVRRASVHWAAKDVFNPAAVVHDGRLCLLFRGEDTVGRFSGTSRIGLATSDDGLHFEVEPEPVLFPDNGEWQAWEWEGGCEDPRLVASPDGGYVCLYTAFDGKGSTLFVATSDDLRTWEKHGPAFAGTPYVRRSSKSGAIVTEARDGRLVAAKVNDQYLMYWGEGTCFAATSSDLIHWAPIEFDVSRDLYLSHQGDQGWQVHRVPGQPVLRPLLFPRPDRFDSLLVEPGPPALKTAHGVVLIYNGAEVIVNGNDYSVSYQPGQALFDLRDPLSPVARFEEPLRMLGEAENLEGQVDNVRFAQGLAIFKGSWFLYYGMGDSRIGCATAPLAG